MTREQLEAEVLQLPVEERARLVESLIQSLDDDSEHERLWAVEIERRWAEIRSGAVKTIPAEDVFRDAEDLLRR